MARDEGLEELLSALDTAQKVAMQVYRRCAKFGCSSVCSEFHARGAAGLQRPSNHCTN